MSDQPTCNSEGGIDGHCGCKVPCFRDKPTLPPPDECPFCEAARRQAKAWGYECPGCLGHYQLEADDE